MRKVYAFPLIVTRKANGQGYDKKPIGKWQDVQTTIDDIDSDYFGVRIPEGLLLVDVDCYRGAHIDTIARAFGVTLDKSALLQRTISGGEHYMFSVPPDVDLQQGSNVLGIEGFDTRVYGKGFMASGKQYTAIGEPLADRLKHGTFPALPEAMLEALRVKPRLDTPREIEILPLEQLSSQYRDLQEALPYISPDQYDIWVKVGMALFRVDGGFGLWDTWSKGSDKYNGAEMESKWRSFANTDVNPESVFWLAREAGWKVSRGEVVSLEDFEAIVDTEKKEIGFSCYPDEEVEPITFVIDGMIQEGFVLFAGQSGAGKSTTLVPMALSAAGLVTDAFPIKNMLTRKVIYFCEDPGQVKRTVHAMAHDGVLTKDRELFESRFRLVQSKRTKPEILASLARHLADMDVANVGKTTYMAPPLVIFDTANANIMLDNENDNSEVGGAISAIRQAFGRTCIWVVSHTSKALKNSEDVTVRGASAWEGDAQQVVYLTIDDDKNRFIQLGKRRFEHGPFGSDHFQIVTVAKTVQTHDVLGNSIEVTVRYSYPDQITDQERAEIKDRAKSEKRDRDVNSKLAAIVEYLTLNPNSGLRDILAAVKGKKDVLQDAILEGLHLGNISTVPHPKRGDWKLYFVPNSEAPF